MQRLRSSVLWQKKTMPTSTYSRLYFWQADQIRIVQKIFCQSLDYQSQVGSNSNNAHYFFWKIGCSFNGYYLPQASTSKAKVEYSKHYEGQKCYVGLLTSWVTLPTICIPNLQVGYTTTADTVLERWVKSFNRWIIGWFDFCNGSTRKAAIVVLSDDSNGQSNIFQICLFIGDTVSLIESETKGSVTKSRMKWELHVGSVRDWEWNSLDLLDIIPPQKTKIHFFQKNFPIHLPTIS